MTEGAHFLAVKPLSVKTTRASCSDAVILNVMRHNARELQAEIGVGADSGIDASRIHLNVTLHGPATADGVASAARDAMRDHGIVAPRKNATLGIEIVASLPAGLGIDHLAYFHDTAAWAQQHYRVPLLSAIVHNDESSPHLHLVLLPVRDGKLVGSKLLGNRATMKAMQKDFHERVASQYGLRMPAAKKRHSAAQRAAGIALLRDTLQANSGLTERAIDALLVPHAKNPEPLLVALGLAMPAPVVKGSFVATMTRKVRLESSDRIHKKSPIGHLRAQTADGFLPENEKSYALLGDCISASNFPPSANPSSATDSAPGQANSAHHQASANTQPDIACPAPDTPQHERSTNTGTTVSTAQHQPSASTVPLVATTNPGTGQAGQQDVHRQPEQLCHQDATAYPQACQHQHGDAGQATTTAKTKHASAKRQAKTVWNAPTALAGTTPKRKHAAVQHQATSTATNGQAGTRQQAARGENETAPLAIIRASGTTTVRDQAASIEHITPGNAKVSHAAPAKRAKASTGAPASWPAATPSTPSTSTRSTSSMAAPSTSTPKPKRTATLQQASGASAQDTLPAKAAPIPATPTRRTAPSRKASSTPALGKGQYDAGADQPDEIRTLGLAACSSMSNASTAPTTRDALKLEPISRVSGSTSHWAEISAQCSWPKFSGKQHSPEYSGQRQVDHHASQHAGDGDRNGAPALGWLPMPAPRINDSTMALQIAPAGIAAYVCHQSPAPVIEQGPLQGGASTVAQLRPFEGEQVQRYVDSYQRLREDEHAAELWDSDLGKFVTALARSARRTSTLHTIDAQCADDQGAVWFDARPAVIEAALDSIRAVHGQH